MMPIHKLLMLMLESERIWYEDILLIGLRRSLHYVLKRHTVLIKGIHYSNSFFFNWISRVNCKTVARGLLCSWKIGDSRIAVFALCAIDNMYYIYLQLMVI